MKRRDFIVGLGAAALSVPSHGQHILPVVGFLGAASPNQYAPFVEGFRRGLKEGDYEEGRNLTIEYRWADGQYDRLPALAAELVAQRVAVLATPGSTPATLAAKAATKTIPIVFFVAGDPIELGLVSNLARPGENITGVTGLTAEVGPKRLELLNELVPPSTPLGLLINPTSPAQSGPQERDLNAAAVQFGRQLHVVQASTESEIEASFEILSRSGIGGLVIGPDVFFNTRSDQLAALALKHRIAAVYQYRGFAAAGGFISYGADLGDMFRLCGGYTARILKGENVAELPVQQATKAELIINLKTAKALGIAIPLPLIGRADEVIE
jgi:ABC-type uncharacterized transport system substrate-binding protein